MDRHNKISFLPVAAMALLSAVGFAGDDFLNTPALPSYATVSQHTISQADTVFNPSNLPIVRANRFSINYQLDPESLKYISRIELWCGRGTSGPWQLYDYDLDRTPPVDFQVSSEGVWRFLVVPVDVNGKRYYEGGAVSQDNNSPIPASVPAQTTLFIDYTAPQIFLHDPIVQTNTSGGRQIILQWNAFDSFLGDQPAELYWVESGETQFKPVGISFKAFDSFTWLVPQYVKGPVCFKLVCRDAAGNVQEKISQLVNIGQGERFMATNPYNKDTYAISSPSQPIASPQQPDNNTPAMELSMPPAQTEQNLKQIPVNNMAEPLHYNGIPGGEMPKNETNNSNENYVDQRAYIQPAVNIIPDGEQIPTKAPSKPQALAGRALSYLELGHEAYQRGEYDRARLLYEQVVSMEPNYYPTYYHLADVLSLQGKYQQAKANFDIFLAQYPDHRKALTGLMYCHLKTGDLDQAKDILENKLNQINDKQQWNDLLEK